MDPRRLEMTVLMTPDMANFSGKVHGGALLNLLDRVAFSCASRYSGRYAVTLSVDQVTFKEPINVGELVTFRASVNHAGRTSMEIGIRVEAENIRAGTLRHTNSCYFTMVAVDDARPPGRGAGARHRDPRRAPPPPRRRAPPQAPPRDRRPSSSAPRRARHEHLVLGRHRPRHRPHRLRPPRRHGHRRRHRRRRRLRRPAVRAARRLRPHRDRAGANVQETCVVHTFPNLGVEVGPSGHIGHGAVLHGCRIGRNAMVGMNAVVMDEAEIGENSIVAAMAFVKAGAVIPPRSLAMGSPARVTRELTDSGDRLEDPRHRRLPAPRRSRPATSSPRPSRSPRPSPTAAASAPRTTTR